MDMRQITPDYAVSGQVTADDAAAIAAAGFRLVICNRPDSEVSPDMGADRIRDAVEATGLRFETLPLTMDTMSLDTAARQRALIDGSEGPVLAYCRSGTRCTVIWALGQAATGNVDEILSRAEAAGYQLDQMRPTLEQIARG